MPTTFVLQKKLVSRSDRVKSMDLHPKEPWMLVSLYNGNVHIWNYDSQVSGRDFSERLASSLRPIDADQVF